MSETFFVASGGGGGGGGGGGENLERNPTEYRMTVHLFGATLSPGCANFALKTTDDDYEGEHRMEAANFVRRNFYVDDGLKSVCTPANTVRLVENTRSLCKQGGFYLHEFVCKKQDMIQTMPLEKRPTSDNHVNEIDVMQDTLPIEER